MLDQVLTLYIRFLRSSPNWQRIASVVAIVIAAAAGASVAFFRNNQDRGEPFGFAALAAIFAMLFFAAVQQARETARHVDLVERAQTQTQEHPDKPLYAWEVGRLKLEGYLDRNLSQVRSIYLMTTVVMVAGFALILVGLMRALDDPKQLPVAAVAAASGVLVSFLGGSLLLIYKSTMQQSTKFVSVLERINAVGMAVQVIESIPAEAETLRNETSAALARELLVLYGADNKKTKRKKKPND